jgi:hypothetical protein
MLALILAAAAADFAVYEGTDAPAAATLLAARGAPTDLPLATYAEAAQGLAPVALGAREVRTCTAGAGDPDLAAALARAESHLKFVEFEAAAAELRSAADALPCLVEPVDRAALQRRWLLCAYAAWGPKKDAAAADGPLRQWLSLDATAKWDKRLPAALGVAAELVRPQVAASASVPLAVEPPAEGLFLDGVFVAGAEAALPLGEHLVQFGGQPSLVVTRDDLAPVHVVVPAFVTEGSLAAIGDPGQRARVERLLAALPVQPEWLVVGAEVYRRVEGAWGVAPVVQKPTVEPSRSSSSFRPVARWGGAGLAVASLAAAGGGLALYLGDYDAVAAAPSDAALRGEVEQRLATETALFYGGLGLAAVGAAGVIASFVVPERTVTVSVAPSPEGALLVARAVLP